jgi:ankyrin repeat protein
MSKSALFKAAAAWDVSTVGRLLSGDPDLAHARDSRGRSALHICARQRWDGTASRARASIATVRALLTAGADINAVHEIPDDGEIFPATALWHAVAWGRNRPLALELLRRGASPEPCLFAVTWADDAPMARMLLKAGARTGLRSDGETPLHYAARLGREKVLRVLVAAGADIHATDAKGRTPLDLARKKGLGEAARRLLGETARGR